MVSTAQNVTGGLKKRSRSDKIGRIKYQGQQLSRIEARLDALELGMRLLLKGLESQLKFDVPFLQRVCCEMPIDAELLDVLREAGPAGLLARDLARQLHTYRQYVSRRVKAMNRRLEREIGKQVVEKRGLRWALSRFAVDAFGEDEVSVEA
jgi:hypothetical protein